MVRQLHKKLITEFCCIEMFPKEPEGGIGEKRKSPKHESITGRYLMKADSGNVTARAGWSQLHEMHSWSEDNACAHHKVFVGWLQ